MTSSSKRQASILPIFSLVIIKGIAKAVSLLHTMLQQGWPQWLRIGVIHEKTLFARRRTACHGCSCCSYFLRTHGSFHSIVAVLSKHPGCWWTSLCLASTSVSQLSWGMGYQWLYRDSPMRKASCGNKVASSIGCHGAHPPQGSSESGTHRCELQTTDLISSG